MVIVAVRVRGPNGLKPKTAGHVDPPAIALSQPEYSRVKSEGFAPEKAPNVADWGRVPVFESAGSVKRCSRVHRFLDRQNSAERESSM
jgi:hypothetical protein